MNPLNKIIIGIDIGTVSIKAAVISDSDINISDELLRNGFRKSLINVSEESLYLYLSPYIRHAGRHRIEVEKIIKGIAKSIKYKKVSVFVTGAGGKEALKYLSAKYINEFRAVAEGVGVLYPEVNTIFEIGGEKSKYVLLKRFGRNGFTIEDYEKNGECAAGTGAFFDQQAERLEVSVEEAGRMILDVKRNPTIAGRCSVFAKSDMIHAQQRGYKPDEVLKGLAYAIVRNFSGNITKGKKIIPKVAFVGGIAFNKGIVQAVKEHFDLKSDDLIVPEDHAWISAAGAALIGLSDGAVNKTELAIKDNDAVNKYYPYSKKLSNKRVRVIEDEINSHNLDGTEFYLGVDIGSISTNFALINEHGNLISGLYKMTKGRPVEVVQNGLMEMLSETGSKIKLNGVGTTGSGRELIGHLIGADTVKDEITAHKTGAQFVADRYIGKKVDTIFEIGGQDSKFISLSDGVVVDFSLNDACAAGTGSFLEEQAKKLGISIKNEFANLALAAEQPLKIGERCTVFMEKEIDLYLQKDIPLENIVAGIALSVVHNYLNRVVKKRRIGDTIFFQGGTAYNRSVAAAFSTVLEKDIIVPPYNGIIGAIGAALLAKEKNKKKSSNFRGWDLRGVDYKEREFVCKGCSNNCTVKEFTVEGEKSYWGDKCSVKYRKVSKNGRKSPIDSLFTKREDLIQEIIEKNNRKKITKKEKIFLPQTLFIIDKLPFWHTFFKELGFEVIIGEKSSNSTGNKGIEISAADPCFPVQISLGHLYNGFKNSDAFVFYPNVINEEDPTDGVSSYICPWGQTLSLVAVNTPALSGFKERLLYPNIQFREGRDFVEKQLFDFIRKFGVKRGENRRAVKSAYSAQGNLSKMLLVEGDKALKKIYDAGQPFIVLVGRPYNMYDFELNLHIPDKLSNIYGVPVVPMDFLPFQDQNIDEINDHMFWNYGRKIMQAAKYTRNLKDSHIIFISNFKCGPDSYIRHYMEEAAGGPYLFLQLDSHANDAGVMTRIEAYLESKSIV